MNAPTISDRARSLATDMEARKVGMIQHQDGDWVVKFKVTADSMPAMLTQAPMGQRFVVALVAIGDNEEPLPASVHVPVRPRSSPDKPVTPRKLVAADKRLAQQAGRVCGEVSFWRFLEDQHGCEPISDGEQAAAFVRRFCNVTSRSQIVLGTAAAAIWDKLYGAYVAWDQVT